jgi:hypothetical protein
MVDVADFRPAARYTPICASGGLKNATIGGDQLTQIRVHPGKTPGLPGTFANFRHLAGCISDRRHP